MLKNNKGEAPEQRASRRWRNKELSERFKRAKETGEGAEDFLAFDGKKPHINAEVPKPPKDPGIGEAITNEGRRKGPVRNLERKFLRDIGALMNEPRERILKQYLQSLERRRYLLLKEKLRRLQAQQEHVEAAK
jgi:hypothetical protein